jgi:hypothetical protein
VICECREAGEHGRRRPAGRARRGMAHRVSPRARQGEASSCKRSPGPDFCRVPVARKALSSRPRLSPRPPSWQNALTVRALVFLLFVAACGGTTKAGTPDAASPQPVDSGNGDAGSGATDGARVDAQTETGSTDSATSSSCPGPVQWAFFLQGSQACATCFLSNAACGSQVAAVDAACPAYFSCLCACGPSDDSCLSACAPTPGSACYTAIGMTACTDQDPGCANACAADN